MTSATEANTAEVERNTGAIEAERGARARLTQALDGLGGVLGGVIRGAPQALSPILSAVPGMQQFATMMGFAEGYIGIWQQLSSRGLHFSNEIDTMIKQVGRANLQMEDFIRITEENTVGMVGLGGTMNEGAQAFLAAQTSFMRLGGEFEPLRRRLHLLGMTSTAIAERFAEFDQIAVLSNMRQRMGDRERNIAAAQFAENLDELARLTGKQVDTLAEEAAELAREGNVYAFSQTLRDNVRDELMTGLTGMGQLGDEIGRYAIDMITRGYPDPNDPEMALIHSQAGEMRELLLAARSALQNGQQELAEDLFRQAREAGRQLQDNGTFISLAMHRNATEMTQAATNILTSGQRSAMVQARNVIVEEAQRLARESGQPFTGSAEQLTRAAQSLIDAGKADQLEGVPKPGGEELLRRYIDSLMRMQGTAANLQEGAVNTAVAGAVRALGSIETQLREFDLNAAVNDALAEAIGLGASIAAGGGVAASAQRMSQRVEEQLTALAEDARAAGNTAEADRLSRLQEELTMARTAYAESQTPERQSALDLAMQAATTEIQANRDVFVSGQNVSIGGVGLQIFSDTMRAIASRLGIELPEERSNGSLGATGRLFENFGRETLMALHGIESVVTPDQMLAIVQNSAMGAMGAMAQVMEQNNSRSTTGMLNGMLNTIRTIPEQIAQGGNTNDINNVMASLPAQLRIPLEEAMNNTLVPRLEQLIGVSTNQLEHSDRIRRGIGNLSTDMLRSA